MLINKMGLNQKIRKKQVVEDETNQSEDPIGDIRSRAQNLVDEAGRAISEAKIKEKSPDNMGLNP